MTPETKSIGSAVLACGGTGGHVYPGIAIARELLRQQPGARVSFVGRESSFEAAALAREGFEMDTLRVGRLAGQGLGTRLRTLVGLPVAVARAASVLRRRRPEVVIGTGGFVSGPTMIAAVLRRTPTLVQEQNAVAGFTNRVLWKLVDRVALAHELPAQRTRARMRVTGNPVRPEFFAVPDWQARRPFCLLVLGGSQGARSLNEATLGAATLLAHRRADLRIVLQCGQRWEEECRRGSSSSPLPIEVRAFLDDVAERMAAASLVLCRSGASTVAELCAAGRPSILVPFPFSAGDHQTANARALCAAGAAEMTADAELTAATLAAAIEDAMQAPHVLAQRARAARRLANPEAAALIVQLAQESVASRRDGAQDERRSA